jgi:hypothetical protein
MIGRMRLPLRCGAGCFKSEAVSKTCREWQDVGQAEGFVFLVSLSAASNVVCF